MTKSGLFSSTCKNENVKQYDTQHPTKEIELPEILQEISGITDLDNNKLACIQDEKGIVFIIDLISGEIIDQHTFGEMVITRELRG